MDDAQPFCGGLLVMLKCVSGGDSVPHISARIALFWPMSETHTHSEPPGVLRQRTWPLLFYWVHKPYIKVWSEKKNIFNRLLVWKKNRIRCIDAWLVRIVVLCIFNAVNYQRRFYEIMMIIGMSMLDVVLDV